jgi:hypothetical protein
MPKKQTKEEWISKSQNIFGNAFDYSKVEYKSSRTKVILICNLHGEFETIPKDHLCYKRGCPICSGFKLNNETFILKSIEIHKNKYLYDKTNYIGCKKNVIITCRIHGDFEQAPDKHINSKHGCPKCNKSHKKDIHHFIRMAKKINGDKYDYSSVNYVSMYKRVKIICSKHGPFLQMPSNHLYYKAQCPKCAIEKNKLTIDEFKARASKKHNNEYDYSKSKYIKCSIKINIICKSHGMFKQMPMAHINGARCPWCVGRNSKKEKMWLDYLKIPKRCRNKTIIIKNKRYDVDAFIRKTNTIYEFYGDYWHGNPKIYDKNFINKHNKKSFGELYKLTIKRKKELIKLGYNIVFIWENDFNKILKKIKKT